MKYSIILTFLLFVSTLNAQLFTEEMDVPFDGVYSSAVAFADVDGDNDQDLIITGANANTAPIAKLYINDGTGKFTEDSSDPFDGVRLGAIAVADVDGDNDLDIMINGILNTWGRECKLYLNDGDGGFMEVMDTPFTGMQDGSISFADVDGDNDLDVLITGRNSPSIPSVPASELYLNEGDLTFVKVEESPFEGVFRGSAAFADIDDDNDLDVFITGENGSDESISKMYTNNGDGTFVEITDSPFKELRNSTVNFSDVDGDLDQDVLITGWNLERYSILYLNDGNGIFTEKEGNPFEKVSDASVAFADVDGDLDLDLIISGAPHIGRISTLYTNDGNANFSEVLDTPFDPIKFGSVAFADIDGDNDLDLLITGENESNKRIAKLYVNNSLSNIEASPFDPVIDFKLYPNPVNDNNFHISLDSFDEGPVSIKITNIKGENIFEKDYSLKQGKQTYSLDVSDLQNGLYVVQLILGKEIAHKTFLIQR